MKQNVLTSVCLLSQVLKIEEGMSAEMYVKLLYMGLLSDITFYIVVLKEFIA